MLNWFHEKQIWKSIEKCETKIKKISVVVKNSAGAVLAVKLNAAIQWWSQIVKDYALYHYENQHIYF